MARLPLIFFVLRMTGLALLALAPAARGQDATDLYLLELERDGDAVRVSKPIRLTNRDGYDNQPAFSADGSRIFFTSMRGEQTDIWQIRLDGDREPEPFRQTPESEYSPTPIPGESALSVIRVEADGRQRLWRLPLDLDAEPSVILPEVEPVGYHAWSAEGAELALFVLGEPHRLVRLSLENPEPRTVFEEIGRSLHYRPPLDAFTFIDKSEEPWSLAMVLAGNDGSARLQRLPEGREDVAYAGRASAGHELWVGDGSRLLRAEPPCGWQEIVDLGSHGIEGITRLAFDAGGERLALIAQRAPEKTRALEIVTRAIEHHGGERFTASETELRQCSRSGCSEVKARVEGERFVYDVSGPRRDGTRRVRTSTDAVELWHDGEPVAIPPNEEQRWRDWAMARVYFPFLPYRLDDPSVWKEDLGLETWNGRQLHKVRVTFDAGTSTDADDVYHYWFDAESAELVYLAYSYSGDPGGLRFRVLENPRRVGGLLFHDQKNYGAEGSNLTLRRLTPESVKDLRLVSTVTFDEIAVQALP